MIVCSICGGSLENYICTDHSHHFELVIKCNNIWAINISITKNYGYEYHNIYYLFKNSKLISTNIKIEMTIQDNIFISPNNIIDDYNKYKENLVFK